VQIRRRSFDRQTQTVHLYVAAALRGGMLHIRGRQNAHGDFTGTVTGGTGRFKGAKGTVSGTHVSRDTTKVVVKYTLP
jgi:hypothetical protein